MSLRALAVVVLSVIAVTTATVSYAVATLPEPGELRRPVVPFARWAEQRSFVPQAIAEQCATANDTDADRAWCMRRQTGAAQRAWRGSVVPDRWTAVELSLKRDLYLVVGAYVLFAFVVGLLTVRVVARLA